MDRRLSVLAAFVLLTAVPLSAQQSDRWSERVWCDQGGWDEHAYVCEVREVALPSGDFPVVVDAGRNGGVTVVGEARSDVLVLARVSARARSEERAGSLLESVRVRTDGGEIQADGPETGRRESWSVSFYIRVPARSDLDLQTHNGGIGIEGVEGTVRFEATNGGVHLADLAGDVEGETRNGGLHVTLAGDQWEGAGLDVATRNGGIHLEVPEGYSAELETGTVNGHLELDFPITVRGRITRDLRTRLGSGGPPVRVVTRNGGVTVTRPGVEG